MTDKIRLEGIFEEGYGLSPKLVMRDQKLTIEAKAIYAYMASFAGNGETAFPKVETACKDLKISRQRFNKHRDLLVERGYLTIKRNREKGKFDNNVYVLNSTVVIKHHHGKTPPWQNDTTNNNKDLNNNNVFNSSSVFGFYESHFGLITPFIAEKINHWIDDLSEDLVLEAMKISVTANKRFNYTEGILKTWKSKNIKSLDDLKEKPKPKKKQQADWSDF